MPELERPIEGGRCDVARTVARWIYAQRRLGLPLSPYHVERIVDALERQIDEVPDELIDETVLQFGMGSFPICEDCGTPGIWPGSRFDALRSEFCRSEIISRRAGQWPEVDSVQLEFNRSYFKLARARLEGNDPGVFYRYSHSPISFDNASPTPNPTEDERPF